MADYTFQKGGKPDKEQFAQLLLSAKGERSYRSFANACNTYPSTLTRIAQKANKGASSMELLEAIAANAAPGSGVTLKQLAHANGYILCGNDSARPAGHPRRHRDPVKPVMSLITRELLERKASVMFDGAEYNVPRFKIGRSEYVSFDLCLVTNAFSSGNVLWLFDVMATCGLSRTEMIRRQITGARYRVYTFLHLLAAGKFPAAMPVRFSIVFNSSEVFEAVADSFSDITVPAYISLLLVDLKSESIMDDCLLPHATFGKLPGYFTAGHRELSCPLGGELF